MAREMVHRGPDDEGAYSDQHIAMGMRRLSIIDLDHGHQPIANEDDSIVIVCNGEIYNFRELRTRLIEKGHKFRTASDTEVVLHLYEEHGPDCVNWLQGMFCFAIWDKNLRRLVIARDRLGVKPLYFIRDHARLIFASESKSILQVPDISATLDAGALTEYLSFGYTASNQSILQGIEKLAPGGMMVCRDGQIDITQYWRLPDNGSANVGERDWVECILDKIRTSVTAEMVSDVPLGAFLSGGIDSSSIVALMAAASDMPIKTYSIGFDTGPSGAYYNELPFARQVSDLFKTEHKEILVRPNVVELLPKLLWHMDEPVADSAFITTYLVAEFARQDVTVILSGVGGDEIFGGYRRYLGDYYGRQYRKLPGWFRRGVLAPIMERLPKDRHSPLLDYSRLAAAFVKTSDLSLEDQYRAYVQVFSGDALEQLMANGHADGSGDSLDDAFATAHGDDGLQRMMHVDMLTQLPNDLLMLTDKMTMAASIECRVPLLNYELVELAARMPSDLKIKNRTLKYVLKDALSDILPKEILHRRKRGFGAPMGAWLKRELAPMMAQVLSRESIENRGIFNWDFVNRTIELHRTNQADHTDHLLSLVNLEIWSRIYLDGRAPSDVTDELAIGLAP